MLQWELSPFSVSPAAGLLSRCVSRAAVSQEDIDLASSRRSPAFSSHLLESEQQLRAQRQLEELHLEAELLNMEQRSADVTHTFHLTRRCQVLQVFCAHLSAVLKDQNSLRHRLMKPLGCTNLPIQAQLHSCVVDLVFLLLDFLKCLEEKVDSLQCRPSIADHLDQLNSSIAQLLALMVEVDQMSNQVLRWKEISGILPSDSLV